MIAAQVIRTVTNNREASLPPDSEIVTGLVAGEATAVALVDGMILRAARPFWRRLRDQWDDIVQEARLEVFADLSRGRFRGESRLATYIWCVVSHTCLDSLRATSRRRWTALEDLTPGAEPTTDDDRREAFDVTDLIWRVLEATPPHCLKIWRLIVEGFSYREMSRMLCIAEGALRVQALRCRRRALAVRDDLLAGRAPTVKQIAELDAQG